MKYFSALLAIGSMAMLSANAQGVGDAAAAAACKGFSARTIICVSHPAGCPFDHIRLMCASSPMSPMHSATAVLVLSSTLSTRTSTVPRGLSDSRKMRFSRVLRPPLEPSLFTLLVQRLPPRLQLRTRYSRQLWGRGRKWYVFGRGSRQVCNHNQS